jgi:hypothetical protein
MQSNAPSAGEKVVEEWKCDVKETATDTILEKPN